MDGVRAGRQSGSLFEHGPEVDATIIAANDGGFGTMQLELVKAELHRTNKELAIRVEPHFVAVALRIPQHDLSDRRGAVAFCEQCDPTIQVERDSSLLVSRGTTSNMNEVSSADRLRRVFTESAVGMMFSTVGNLPCFSSVSQKVHGPSVRLGPR